MIKAVLFDLDGTLLPLNEEKFMKLYFGNLGKKFLPYGYHPEKLINAVLAGTTAMRENKGDKTNDVVFWPVFYSLIEGNHEFIENTFLDFYKNEFDLVKESVQPSIYPRMIIDHLKQKGYRVILATNPLFPRIATEKRIAWAGLEPGDFEYISTYENSKYSKPSLGYYKTIMEIHGLDPKECLMVGNDAYEDMACASLGSSTFLLTDCLNNHQHIDINIYKNGTMEDLYNYICSFKNLKGLI